MGRKKLYLFTILFIIIKLIICDETDSEVEKKTKKKQPVILLSETFIAEHRASKESPCKFEELKKNIFIYICSFT